MSCAFVFKVVQIASSVSHHRICDNDRLSDDDDDDDVIQRQENDVINVSHVVL